MIEKYSSGGELKPYYDDKLIVKMRPAARQFRAGPMKMASVANESTGSGLGLLLHLERAGMVKAVTPLASVPRQAGPPDGTTRGSMTFRAVEALSEDEEELPGSGAVLVELERGSGRTLADLQLAIVDDPLIEAVSQVPIRYLKLPSRQRPRAGAAAAPPEPSTLWNLQKIRWREARDLESFQDADAISVAVLDSGIDDNHEDLREIIAGYTSDHPDLSARSSPQDIIGHGTHVAGTIAADISNRVGINGVCRCALHAWKIFPDQTTYDSFGNQYVYFVDTVMYHRALRDCWVQGIRVVNLSIGGSGRPDPNEEDLFSRLLARETVVVAAMGNERRQGSPTSYPAAIPGVIAVGATTIDDRVATFSNRGQHISISAPGVGIWSTLPTYAGQTGFDADPGPREGRPHRREVNYDAWDGTSMATPHVAAAAALLLAKNGPTGTSVVKRALETSAEKIPGLQGREHHPDYGHGRLDLESLLRP
jgi:subtilisin family serine protease